MALVIVGGGGSPGVMVIVTAIAVVGGMLWLRGKSIGSADVAIIYADIGNLKEGGDTAWRKIIGLYTAMGALTWTEDAATKAKLDKARQKLLLDDAQSLEQAVNLLAEVGRLAPGITGYLLAAVASESAERVSRLPLSSARDRQ